MNVADMIPRFSDFSLRTRLALRIALIAAVMTAVGVGIGFWTGTAYLARSHEASIRSHMRLASVALAPSLLSMDYLGLQRQLDMVMEYEGIIGARILDQNGHALLERGTMNGAVLSEPIAVEGAVTGRIDVAFSSQPIRTGMLYVLGVGVLLFIGFVPLFIYLVWRISGHYLLDLSRLTERVETEFRDVSPEYPGERRSDEIGVLASALHRRDQALAANIQALEKYQSHLEDLVQERTAALRRSEMLGRTILSGIPEAIALVEVSTQSVLDVNEAFEVFYERSRADLIGADIREVLLHAGRWSGNGHECPIGAFRDTGGSQPVQVKFSGVSGRAMFLEVAAWPVVNENEEVHQLVFMQRDVTEQNRVANLRKDVERIVHHDLRTPLVGILGVAQLMMDENDPELVRTYSEHIIESGRRMLEMLTNSMDLFNMEEGRYVLRPERFNLTAMIRMLDEETRPLREQRGVKTAFLLGDDPLDWHVSLEMVAEKRHVHSMLLNLLNNAVEAAPRGTSVALRVQRADAAWTLETHNMGVVPEEIREHFFDRYVTAGKPRGTGLGTYSAMLIARIHGGRITFSTNEEQGTRVTVELPLIPPSACSA
ncbi:sensor histidine kinase [Desulfonatronum lacustre]|uniref:sensor histidine kinase n=1 Tax=Desulfonatronum lacustre TaxID=66849 RepID=UPI0004BCFDCF|nr:ATP-binding protein [Desulfonatronum lacustre]